MRRVAIGAAEDYAAGRITNPLEDGRPISSLHEARETKNVDGTSIDPGIICSKVKFARERYRVSSPKALRGKKRNRGLKMWNSPESAKATKTTRSVKMHKRSMRFSGFFTKALMS